MNERSRKIVLPGGSGFLGRMLASWFRERGWEVVILTRQPAADSLPTRSVAWDGATLGEWRRELEGADAVVNLAGRSVNCRYHQENRRAILESRIAPTRVLGEAILRCNDPPAVWLNSSTATIYKHSFEQAMDEATGEIGGTPQAKDQFSVDVALAWEQALAEAEVPATRKIALRTAMVFGVERGTVYRVLRRLARLGLGGSMAGGRQFVSWIHEYDFCRAIEWLIDRDDLAGPVNVAAPYPVTNREMMRFVRHTCGVPIGLPASRWMLEFGALLLRTETELVIKSRRVVPGRLLASGFEFRYPGLHEAVRELDARLRGRSDPPTIGLVKGRSNERHLHV